MCPGVNPGFRGVCLETSASWYNCYLERQNLGQLRENGPEILNFIIMSVNIAQSTNREHEYDGPASHDLLRLLRFHQPDCKLKAEFLQYLI